LSSPINVAPRGTTVPEPELSVQLYTVRNALAEDFDQTLGRLAGFGFTAVEPFGFDKFVPELKSGLAKHGLTAPTTHVGLLAGDQDAIFAAATDLGVETLIVPSVDQARWQQADDVAQIATELNAAAGRAAEHGLRVGYHNHQFELESMIDGRHALEFLADQLNPGVVLEVDTYWAYAGGADVPALLGRLGDRVAALHVKDGDGTMDKLAQVAVGSGSLPVWDFIAAAPDALRVIELDDSAGDLFDALRDSRTFLLNGPAE
jgi:sugar phosphate isomerase/epimerase